jgi:hypothetical protein
MAYDGLIGRWHPRRVASTTYRLWGRSEIHGFGIFALRAIPKGTKIHLPRRGLDHGFNHSHEPNVAHGGKLHLLATRDIPAGAELVSFYHIATSLGDLVDAAHGCSCPVCKRRVA